MRERLHALALHVLRALTWPCALQRARVKRHRIWRAKFRGFGVPSPVCSEMYAGSCPGGHTERCTFSRSGKVSHVRRVTCIYHGREARGGHSCAELAVALAGGSLRESRMPTQPPHSVGPTRAGFSRLSRWVRHGRVLEGGARGWRRPAAPARVPTASSRPHYAWLFLLHMRGPT